MGRKINTSILFWISNVSGKKQIYVFLLTVIQIALGINRILYVAILKKLIDSAASKEKNIFEIEIVFLSAVTIIQVLFRAIVRFLEEYSRVSIENSFKLRLVNYLLKKDYDKVSAIHSGEWMNRLTSDTAVVAEGMTQIVPGICGLCSTIIGAVVLMYILESWLVYIILLSGIILCLIAYLSRRMLKSLHKKMQEADGTLRMFLQEVIENMVVVRAFVKENKIIKKLKL